MDKTEVRYWTNRLEENSVEMDKFHAKLMMSPSSLTRMDLLELRFLLLNASVNVSFLKKEVYPKTKSSRKGRKK